jgi:hypothetical protein
VAAELGDAADLDDGDAVGVPGGVQSVGDGDDGAAPDGGREGALGAPIRWSR